MTENEAKRNNSANSSYTKNILHTETCEKCLYIKSRCKCNKSDDNAGYIGINEAQEYLLNRYLVVGSPVNPPKEECEKHNAVLDIAIQALEEIQQYRALGTVEEFKALKEKSEQKKPNNIPMDDACIYYENHCPNCDSLLVVRYKCCPKCGQKIDWSE